MACPHFEPQRATQQAKHPAARLPLIDEYDGICHAGDGQSEIPASARFRFCNHGYSRGECGQEVSATAPSCIRFELTGCEEASLEMLVIEEQDYAPVRWSKVTFKTADDRIEPDIADPCVRAQVRAFCHSYLRHFVQKRSDVEN
jgi:hypothetical protein